MDIRKVKKLIDLLENSSVDEIEIHEGDGSVRVSRDIVRSARGAGASLSTARRALHAVRGHRLRRPVVRQPAAAAAGGRG